MTTLGVIPVRFGATRFPGKPLAPILGRPMLQWVYEGARRSRSIDRLLVATDDERIAAAARSFGAEAVLTSPDCPSGTDRVAEAASGVEADLIVNIQGDEPLIEGAMLDALIDALAESGAPMASLMARVDDPALALDPHRVKVVTNGAGEALYFSRSPIPHGAADFVFVHIGIYAYRRDFLFRFRALPPARLETAERLEQLRALENGFRIRMVEIAAPTLSVDTPADIIGVEQRLQRRTHE
jgi:3-deoxy-manno-octulosonate cytidylyltransferase (CMP-KDO synthetase)